MSKKKPDAGYNQLVRRNSQLAKQVREVNAELTEARATIVRLQSKPSSVGVFVQLMEEINELADTTLVPLLLADGLEDALIGYTLNHHHPACAVYDYGKCMTVLQQRDNMTPEEAEECLDFNTLGAYVGEHGPLFVRIPS